jgi:hypothetical protein
MRTSPAGPPDADGRSASHQHLAPPDEAHGAHRCRADSHSSRSRGRPSATSGPRGGTRRPLLRARPSPRPRSAHASTGVRCTVCRARGSRTPSTPAQGVSTRPHTSGPIAAGTSLDLTRWAELAQAVRGVDLGRETRLRPVRAQLVLAPFASALLPTAGTELTFRTASMRMSTPCFRAVAAAASSSARVPQRVPTARFCSNSPRSHCSALSARRAERESECTDEIVRIVALSALRIHDLQHPGYDEGRGKALTGRMALLGGGSHSCVTPSAASVGISSSMCLHQLICSCSASHVNV